MKIWTKIRALFNRRRLEREMTDEMQTHLDALTERNIATGMTPKEARFAAMRSFGGMEQTKEECRDTWGIRVLQDFWHDLRYGLRQLQKAPGFAAVAILTLAIGVGSTTAIFSVVNSVILQPLPFRDVDRLVALRETSPRASDPYASKRWPWRLSFQTWKEQATVFDHVVGASYWQCIMTGAGDPARYYGWRVTDGFFKTLGVQPILGRTFLPEEWTAGREQVAIISHRLWLNHFDGRENVIGQSVKINDQFYTIVGVLPPRLYPETITDPALFSPDTVKIAPGNISEIMHEVIGRLKPGVTLAQASSEINLISARLAQDHSDSKKDWGSRAMWLLDVKVGEARPFLFMLLGAVGFLLLIACFNVANLLLARASARAKEISIRAALGAGRGRIVRQLLSESLLLAVFGAVLGVMLAYLGLQVLLDHAPLSLPRTNEVSLDGTVLFFSCGLALITGLGFGLAPALQSTRGNLSEVMNDASRGSSENGRNKKLRNSLVVLEISFALVLLTMAVLLTNSFARLKQIPLGYQPGNSYISRIFLQENRYPTSEKKMTFVDATIERLSAVPGVESVVFSNRFPSYGWSERAIAIESRPDLDPLTLPQSSYYTVTLDYFRAISVSLEAGRLFDAHDSRDSDPVAIISRGVADKYFPDTDPVGKRITIRGTPDVARRIIGVVATVRDLGPLVERPFQVYVPLDQDEFGSPHLMVSVNNSFTGLESSLRQAMDLVDPDMPLSFNGIDLEGFLNETIAPQRYALFLFGVFSSLALLLSAMGIYGVVAFAVTQRTKEIGIRMALGARYADIQRLIFSQTGRMLGWGILIGLTVSLLTTRFLGSLLYEVSAHDPLTYVAVSLILSVVALLACWVPACRAAKVDPNTALRSD